MLWSQQHLKRLLNPEAPPLKPALDDVIRAAVARVSDSVYLSPATIPVIPR